MEYVIYFFNALFLTLGQAAPYIIIGYLIAAIIREFVPMKTLVKHFGDKGFRPLLHSVSIGAVLPICSCGVVPLGIGLNQSGTARGTTLSFMTSAPAISPVAVLLGLSLLGPKLTILHICAVILGSVLIGFFGNKLLGGLKDKKFREKFGDAIPAKLKIEKKSFFAKLLSGIRWAFWDLGSEVSLDLLFGLSLAALIVAFIPMEWISGWVGQQNLESLILVIIVSIPIYTCSIPSVAVAQTLLLLGMSPGAAIAFLIGGPGTNLGEINAIRHQMGTKTSVYYVISLIILALLAGTVVDQLFFSDYEYKASKVADDVVIQQCCVPLPVGEQGRPKNFDDSFALIPTWHYPFICLLSITLLLGAFRHLYSIWVNPCQFCEFWREELEDSGCSHRCWKRKVHRFIKGSNAKGCSIPNKDN